MVAEEGIEKPVSIDEAIRRGRTQVMFPSMICLFAPLGLLLWGTDDLPGWVWAVALPGAFLASWLWWAVTIPRWRVWAIENVEDITELIFRAVSAQLMWLPGNFFEKTEIVPPALRQRQNRALRSALARESQAQPEEVEVLRSLVDPWLYPDRNRNSGFRWRGLGSAGWLLGTAGLGISAASTVTHFLYDSPLSSQGVLIVVGVGLGLTLWGRAADDVEWSVVVYWFCMYFGLLLANAVGRSYPWRGTELLSLAMAVVVGLGGFFGMRSKRRR